VSEYDANYKPSPQMQAIIDRTIANMKAAFYSGTKVRARLKRPLP